MQEINANINFMITISETSKNVGKQVTLNGWVQNIRNLGQICFIDLRDHTGLLQLVADDIKLPKLGTEFVVEVTGTIRDRDPKFVNEKLPTGKIELGVEEIKVISVSAEPPFGLRKDTRNINEELRLQYRYLDLRSGRMANNLRLRHQVARFVRNFLDESGFTEVETPHLTKGTPEGAREYIVPSRLHPGEFYVLPQSPQQFKQLLMVAGLGKYYQIAKCMRDEDQRGDRQPEFTQLDIEMSFVTEADVMAINEQMLIDLVKTVTPEKNITTLPFPRLTYEEAMDKYKTDKPDLRHDKNDPNELAFCWVTDFPMFEKDSSGKHLAVHHPFTAPKDGQEASEPLQMTAKAYDIALNGLEIGGGSIRISTAELQHKMFEVLGLGKDEIKARFGHMLEAFTYGVPPHGGIAYGFDRLVMILAGEPNIREVIAFPKTGDGRDPLMGSPSPLPAERLAEANIQSVKKSK